MSSPEPDPRECPLGQLHEINKPQIHNYFQMGGRKEGRGGGVHVLKLKLSNLNFG